MDPVLDAPLPAAHAMPRAAARSDPAEAPPVFILGAQRSGTTLLRLMLNAHRDMLVPHESAFITGYARRLDRFNGLRRPEDLRRALEAIGREPHIVKGGLIPHPGAVLDEPIADYPDLVRAIYRVLMRRAGKRRWADKTPSYTAEVDVLLELFPECRIVHLVRDGRDVAASLRGIEWGLAKHPAPGAGVVLEGHAVSQGRSTSRVQALPSGALRIPGARARGDACRHLRFPRRAIRPGNARLPPRRPRAGPCGQPPMAPIVGLTSGPGQDRCLAHPALCRGPDPLRAGGSERVAAVRIPSRMPRSQPREPGTRPLLRDTCPLVSAPERNRAPRDGARRHDRVAG